MAPGEPLASILGALHEEGADSPRREAHRVHGYSRRAVRLRHQPLDDGTQELLQHRFVKPVEKAVHDGMVGPIAQSQGRAELRVFGQTDFGFTEGPLCFTRRAYDRAQLRLLEPMFRKVAAVGRQ
jgi:hypothetical protein